jgi:hypothetical protein
MLRALWEVDCQASWLSGAFVERVYVFGEHTIVYHNDVG